jgi:two-component system, cell cycle sensor histidine kinase and response regulator CckA
MPQTVLAADADASVRRRRHDLLRTAGFSVIDAASGVEALRSAAAGLPALIILAVELPDMDGLAVCKRLKADPRTAPVPVLHISRDASRGDYAESLESGADAYLTEPVEPSLLLAVVQTLLRTERPPAAQATLSALLEGIPDEVWFTDAAGTPTPTNPPAFREFHGGAEPAAGSREVLRSDGTPRPMEEAPSWRALRGETVRSQEEIVRTPASGESRYRQVSAAPVSNAGGTIVGAVSVVRDITERRRAEQAVRAVEQRYTTLFETMVEGFALAEIICDAAEKPCDFRYLAVNPAFERQTGLKAEDILGRTARELFPDAEPVWFERYGKVALTGEPARFEQWFAPLGRCFEVSAFRTEPGRFGVVFTDVTERKRAEAERQRLAGELADRVGELQAILDAAPVAVWLAHDPQCLRITGNAFADQVVMQTGRGANISAGAPPGEAAVSYQVFRKGVELRPDELPNQVSAAAGLPVKAEEYTLVFPDGRTVHMLLGAVPLFDAEGRVRGSVAAGADITQHKRAEEALRESEAVLRSFFESPGAMRGIVEAVDGRIVHVSCNAAAAELLGADRETIAGKSTSETGTPEELAQPWADLYEMSRRTGKPVSMEYARPGADGTQRWLLATADHLGTGPSGYPRFSYTAIDLTARKRAEERLRESEAVLRGFFDSPGMMRGFVELVDGAIVHVSCNAAAAEMFGVDPESLSGMSAAAAGASEDVIRPWLALYEQSRRTGEPVSMEYARRVAGQKDRWLLATASYLGARPSGNPRFAYTILDLTERKHAEDALRESEERFRIMADGCPTIIWVTDREGEVRFVNRAYREFFGVTYDDVKGGRWQPPVHPDDAPEYVAKFRRAIFSRAPFRAEARVRRADGEWRLIETWAETRLSPGGEFLGHAGVISDITERKQAEDALRESESRLRTLGDNLPEGAIYRYRQDIHGKPRVEFISAGIERLTGVPAAEFMADAATVVRNIVPEDLDRLNAAIAWSRERLTRFEVEVRHRRRQSDELRWSLLRSTPSRCPDGSTVWDGIELDITERKRAEEALRESENIHRAIGESIDYGVWICAPDGRNTYASESFLKLVGLTQEQCSNFGWGEVLHPDDAERTIAAWKECVRTEGRWDREHRFRGVDGEWHPVLARGVPVRDEQGRITCWAGINLDIGALKRSEESLRASEGRERARAAELEALMDAAPAAIFLAHDAECRSMTGNRTCYELLRQPPAGNLSKSAPNVEMPANFRAMKDGVEIPARDLPVQKAASTGRPVRDSELELLFEDGSSVNLLGDAVPMLDENGTPRGAVGVFVDITERKRAEDRLREAQKLESLGLLAGGVAHDFNNLLVGVIGNASLAQEILPPDSPALDLLERVVKTGEQAAHLTRQMLAYAGKGKFLVEALNLSDLIPEMSSLLRTSISRMIALHYDLAKDLPLIEADRGQVEQVFMNLMLNAAEAIESREGLIAVRTCLQNVDARYLRLHPEAAALRPGPYVCLEVRDTGCGMDEATRARIFDPFFSTKFTGRGLGLAAVAGILRSHKGAILVTSAPGKGSCFTVLLPAASCAADNPRVSPRDPALRGSGVVLVVDDEPVVRMLAKAALERHGYTVLLADGAPRAIEILEQYPGDIALMVLDLSMPKMSGAEALPEFRRIRPELKVLVSSGYSEAETMILFEGRPVSGFVQKPYSASRLAEEVGVALK